MIVVFIKVASASSSAMKMNIFSYGKALGFAALLTLTWASSISPRAGFFDEDSASEDTEVGLEKYIPTDQDPRKTLIHYPLDPVVPCGDGSPAGFYTDAHTTADTQKKNHIINFMGGGGCASTTSCGAIQEQQPYMLSSLFEPAMIEGATILSNDPNENPAMASFTKWNVPYCSQDLWLGNTDRSEDLIRSGSMHVTAVLDHWLDEVLKVEAVVDTLVIAGVSAGTMAILNHFDSIQTVAEAAGVKYLRLVLDSSLYPDRIDTDFSSLLEHAVDPQDHPLCFKEWTDELQHEALSKLPCCLSTHCMLRHSDTLYKWARSWSNSTSDGQPSEPQTRMLLIDAAYDSLQAFIDLSSDTSPANALPSGGLSSLPGSSSTAFNVAEYAGRRKARVVETMFGGENQLGPNVIWAMSSAPGHNVLIPSVELSSRLCQSGKLAEESSCNGARDCVFSNYPGGIVQVCNATGSGLKLPLSNGFHMTMWTTTESWKLITVNGHSIQEVISKFVAPATSGKVSISGSSTLLIDSCPGPNCVPKDSVGGNTAQSLIEIEDTFTPISTWLRILISVIVASIPLFHALTICQMKMRTNDEARVPQQMDKSQGLNVYLDGLNVFSGSGDQILDDVSLKLKCSTLNCLLGKSGSGKSCLLGVLSRQLRSNLKVQFLDGTDLSGISCTFMRQQDLGMEHMTPNNYLRTTASVYGTDEERLHFVLNLARPFFPVKKENNDDGDEIIMLDPFNNAPIKECSGGQRRMLSIATALFQQSSLLLLDEPLSGVDSASSDKIIDLLRSISRDNSITVLMTLHQPSDDILSKMDKVMIMGNGRVLFDGEFGNDSGSRLARSASLQVHSIITNGTNDELSHGIQLSSPNFDRRAHWALSRAMSKARAFDRESDPDIHTNDANVTSWQKLRLWQVQPLLRRLHLEYPPNVQDMLVLPICYAAISLWGSFDSNNPIQGFMVTAALTYIPSVLFQTRLIMNWGVLGCHIWDLEDKRIYPLSYLIASGTQMLYIPLLSIITSFLIAYGIFGWQWGSFLDVVLFSTMLTISALQFGKALCAALQTYQAVAGCYSVYIYLGSVCSGFFVNPAKIPSYLHWIMYISIVFWGVSGAELSQLEHVHIGEEQCLSFVSCIVYNRNFVAEATGYTTVTTAHQSMVSLFVATVMLVLIEYCFLLRKVSQRGNYETVKPDVVLRRSSIVKTGYLRNSVEAMMIEEGVFERQESLDCVKE